MFKEDDIVNILVYKQKTCNGLAILKKFCYHAGIYFHKVHPVSAGYDKYNNQIVLSVNGKYVAVTNSAYKMMKFLIWGNFSHAS